MPDMEKVRKALEVFNKNRICLPHLIPWDEIADVIILLKEQEAVILCKDCKHWRRCECGSYGSCEERDGFYDAEWFCADGERKEGK